MSASTDPWEAQLDREFERIMAMTNEELRAELIAEGLDPDEVPARFRELLERARKNSGL